MHKSPTPIYQLSLRLSPEFRADLYAYAERQGIPVVEVVRRGVYKLLEEEAKEKKG